MKKNKRIVQLLTAVSFLLILMVNEKFAVFMFFYLVMMPILVADGAAENVLGIPLTPAVAMLANFIYFGLIYFAVIQLLRCYFYRIETRMADKLGIFGIVVLMLVASRVFPSALKDTASLISLIVFFTLATTGLILTIIDLKRKKALEYKTDQL